MATANFLLPSSHGYGVTLCRNPSPYPSQRKPSIPFISHRKTHASSSLQSPPLPSSILTRNISLSYNCSFSFNQKRNRAFPPRNPSLQTVSAYISAPASDPNSLLFFNDKDNASPGLLKDGDDLSKAPKEVITWKLIWKLMLEEKLRLAISALALIVGTTSTLSMPLFSGRLFTSLIGNSSETLWQILSQLAVIYCLEPIFTIIFVTNMTYIWENVTANLRRRVFQRVLIQKVEFFDRHKVGELTALISSELGSIKNLVNDNVSRDRGFRAVAEAVGTLGLLFTLSPQLAPVLGLLMLCISVLVGMYKRTTVPIFKSHGLAQTRIIDWASETFAAIRTVRSFGGERRQIAVFDEQVRAYQQNGIELGWLKSANESWTRVVVYISLMAVYILGGSKVKSGELAVSTMVSFIGYTFTLTFAVQGLVSSLGDVRTVLGAIDRINSVVADTEVDESLAFGLERDVKESLRSCSEEAINDFARADRPARTFPDTKTVCELAWSGDVVLEGKNDLHQLNDADVSFAYPLRPDAEVLKGINLVLKKGTITAVVGSSGAGKSTIVQLLARFYEPTKGRVLLAGEDVRRFDKSEWARAVSIVNQIRPLFLALDDGLQLLCVLVRAWFSVVQLGFVPSNKQGETFGRLYNEEPVLFAMSIAENIAYGLPNEDVTQESIIAAAKAANAHDFILSLPMGYKTLVGERGSLLSGGQRQRIAIARALLKNAPLLILDEATSALDTVSERLVQDALDKLMKGRTTLVIAHRLSTVQKADQIAVCIDGKIVELGTHAELVRRGGAYSSLMGSQRFAFD